MAPIGFGLLSVRYSTGVTGKDPPLTKVRMLTVNPVFVLEYLGGTLYSVL